MSAACRTGIMSRLFHRLERVAFIQFILLVLAITSIGGGLAEIISDLASNPTFLLALLGTFTGWQLARSRWNAWRAAGITILCGAVISLLTIGGLAVPLWALVAAIFTIRLQFAPGLLIDTSHIPAAWGRLGEALGGLLARLAGWFQLVGNRAVASDPLVIGLLWGLALWLLAGWAAWMVRRRSTALPALLPGMALLVWASVYTNSIRSLLALLLVGAELIALQITQNYLSSRRGWMFGGLERVDIEPRLFAWGVGLSVGLAIVGTLAPSISVKDIAETLDRMTERRDDVIAESLGLQATPGAPAEDTTAAIHSISSTHTVGAGQELSSQVVMTVIIEGYQPPPAEASISSGLSDSQLRYYWRSQSFDFYTGRGWTVSNEATTRLEPGQAIRPTGEILAEDYRWVTQHVTRRLEGGSVLVTGELIELDQPATVTWHGPDDFTGASTQADVYSAESLVPLVTVETLRKAGVDYPEQIRQDYLQLIDELPERVRNLAFEITIHQTNPYDRATAIEAYLRQFPYTLDVPAPPAGRDAADFFLFDLQQGYCDYYATTMVVLARAAGIPARLVVGYSRGSFDEANGTFIVRASNAHAWVEIYFPGAGWIEFEPTSNQPGIARLHDPEAPVKAGQPPAIPALPELPALTRVRRWLEVSPGWLAAAGVILLLALLIPLEGWLLRLQKPERALEIIQQRLYRLGHRWKLPRAGALTPYEFSAALAARLDPLARLQRPSILAAIRRDLEWLTGLYVRSLYAGAPPSQLERRQAVHAWLGLKRRIWWLRLRFWRNK